MHVNVCITRTNGTKLWTYESCKYVLHMCYFAVKCALNGVTLLQRTFYFCPSYDCNTKLYILPWILHILFQLELTTISENYLKTHTFRNSDWLSSWQYIFSLIKWFTVRSPVLFFFFFFMRLVAFSVLRLVILRNITYSTLICTD